MFGVVVLEIRGQIVIVQNPELPPFKLLGLNTRILGLGV